MQQDMFLNPTEAKVHELNERRKLIQQQLDVINGEINRVVQDGFNYPINYEQTLRIYRAPHSKRYFIYKRDATDKSRINEMFCVELDMLKSAIHHMEERYEKPHDHSPFA